MTMKWRRRMHARRRRSARRRMFIIHSEQARKSFSGIVRGFEVTEDWYNQHRHELAESFIP